MEWLLVPILAVVVLIFLAVVQVQRRQAGMDRKLNALLQHFKIDPSAGMALSERVKELARDPAKKIEAIKVYREETGASLVEAKEAVEAFISIQS